MIFRKKIRHLSIFFHGLLTIMTFASEAGISAASGSGGSAVTTDVPAASQEATVSLVAGESTTITPQGSGDLLISRKGIVDAFYGEGTWKITGLRKGLVSLRSGSQHWLVSVSDRENRYLFSKASLPDRIFAGSGLTADPESQTISGLSRNRHKFVQAWRWCKTHPSCYFDARLSESEAGMLIRAFHLHVPEELKGKDHPQGAYRMYEYPCHDQADQEMKYLQHLKKIPFFDVLEGTGLIRFQCTREHAHRMWDVSSKIIATSMQDGLTQGFKSDLDIFATWTGTGEISARVLSRLESMLSEKKASILGEPRLMIREGFAGTISSGGELAPSVYSARKANQGYMSEEGSWKTYGMSLSVKIHPLLNQSSRKTLSLQYTLKFSQPLKGDRKTMSSDTIQSELSIPVATPVLVGQTRIQSDLSAGSEHPLLSGLPLIGPLFRQSEKTNAHTNLWVWISVSPVDNSRPHSEKTPSASKIGTSDSPMETTEKRLSL